MNVLKNINSRVKKLADKEGKLYYCGRYFHIKNPHHRLFFIGEMPTRVNKSKWNPSDGFNLLNTDKKFQDILKENKIEAYITDIVKLCNRAGRPSKNMIDKNLPYLIEEINALKPNFIVALGKDAFGLLIKHSDALPCKTIRWIWHPSNLRWPNRVPVIRNQIKKLSQLVTYTTKKC